MARKLKIMENEKHLLDDLKNDGDSFEIEAFKLGLHFPWKTFHLFLHCHI